MSRDGPSTRRYSRRQALGFGLSGLAGICTTGVLAACGGTDPTPGRAGRDGSAPPRSPALPPWDDTVPAGPRTGLPERLAWANTSDAEFFLAFTRGMEAATERRGMEFLTAIARDDPQANIAQIESFLARGIGGLMVQPLDETAQRTVMERALAEGIGVMGLVMSPTTLQVAANQYDIGQAQGEAAADFVATNLGGEAEVHYFNLDNISPQLVLRHQGVLAGLATGGDGIRVVSDLTARGISVEDGFSMMSSVIQAHPDVKVVLGGDTLVVGALRAFEEAGRSSDDLYLAGVDGDAQALEAIRRGGPYKASIAFAWELMGFGIGQFGADWIEGRSIPRVMVAKPILLDSAAGIDEYLRANASPAEVFADRSRFETYLPLLGNVSYESRDLYWREEYVPA